MPATPELSHELVNVVPILMHVLREVWELDRSLHQLKPRHGNWQGLSLGQVMVTWLAHILSEGDHFMSHVQDWANSNASARRLPLLQAVLAYREERLVERDCARLKGRPLSLGPLWVSRDPRSLSYTDFPKRDYQSPACAFASAAGAGASTFKSSVTLSSHSNSSFTFSQYHFE